MDTHQIEEETIQERTHLQTKDLAYHFTANMLKPTTFKKKRVDYF